MNLPSDKMKFDNKEQRFGTIAVQKRFVTNEQIRKVLEIQSKEDQDQKTHRRIGRILVDEGLIDDVQVYQILGILNKSVK